MTVLASLTRTMHRAAGRTAALLPSLFLAVPLAAGAVHGANAWEMRVCADPERLPFSRIDGGGYENRIAEIIAKELGAELTYVWFPASEAMVQDYLRTGECDIIMGVPDGHDGLASTLAYMRSPFVFLQRSDRPWRVEMFDDPRLKDLRIGIQPPGGPTHDALVQRGLAAQIIEMYDYELLTAVADVENDVIDVAVLWGPVAGYYANKQEIPLVALAVTPEFEPPFTPMFLNMVMAVRRGDESLRDLIDIAMVERWDDIQAVLQEFNLPLMFLAQPMLTIGGN